MSNMPGRGRCIGAFGLRWWRRGGKAVVCTRHTPAGALVAAAEGLPLVSTPAVYTVQAGRAEHLDVAGSGLEFVNHCIAPAAPFAAPPPTGRLSLRSKRARSRVGEAAPLRAVRDAGAGGGRRADVRLRQHRAGDGRAVCVRLRRFGMQGDGGRV